MSDSFTKYVKCDNIIFKYAKGISDHSGKEFHLFNEIILFLGGDAELISETVHTKLEPNTLIVIPKETYHQVLIRGKQDEYCRCVFQFYENYYNAVLVENSMKELFITENNKNTFYLFSKMMSLAKASNEELYAPISHAVLNLLLAEIGERKGTKADKNLNFLNDGLTKQIIEYISENLTEDLSIENIALHFNASPSTVMHTFKKNMNISVHKYIIKKRLILAHSKISNGEQAIIAANECGFNDYSGFYKQYVKMFDMYPSKNK